MIQRIIPIESSRYIPPEQYADGFDTTAAFGNDRPLALEIGCGTGHFIIERSLQQPDVNFLAIDIYNKGCLKTCKKLDATGINNVRVLRIEARYLLQELLPPESLSAVYINCPDPWPKKRHRERRLVNRGFLEVLRHYLVPDGDLYFITDVEDYAEEVAATLHGLPGYLNQQDVHISDDLPGYPVSKYMQRFRDLGQPLYYQHHRRDPKLLLQDLPKPDFERGFRTDWKAAENA